MPKWANGPTVKVLTQFESMHAVVRGNKVRAAIVPQIYFFETD